MGLGTHDGCGDDDWETGRELDTDKVGGHDWTEQNAWSEPSGDRVGVGHGTRVEDGEEWEENEIFPRVIHEIQWLEEPHTQRTRTVSHPNRYESEG